MAGALAAADESLSRLVITRETVAEVLDSPSDQSADTGVARGAAVRGTGRDVALYERITRIFAEAGAALRPRQVCEALGISTEARLAAFGAARGLFDALVDESWKSLRNRESTSSRARADCPIHADQRACARKGECGLMRRHVDTPEARPAFSEVRLLWICSETPDDVAGRSRRV